MSLVSSSGFYEGLINSISGIILWITGTCYSRILGYRISTCWESESTTLLPSVPQRHSNASRFSNVDPETSDYTTPPNPALVYGTLTCTCIFGATKSRSVLT